MSAFVRGAILGCIVLAVVIQFYRPSRSNPPIVAGQTLEAAVAVPPTVQQILVRACNDCHSDQTHWPWYSSVAPISWMVSDHVMEGRRHLNISEWLRPDVDDPAEYTRQKFTSACRELRIGRMPLFSYELAHPAARLSPADIQTFCDWTGSGITAR